MCMQPWLLFLMDPPMQQTPLYNSNEVSINFIATQPSFIGDTPLPPSAELVVKQKPQRLMMTERLDLEKDENVAN